MITVVQSIGFAVWSDPDNVLTGETVFTVTRSPLWRLCLAPQHSNQCNQRESEGGREGGREGETEGESQNKHREAPLAPHRG